MTKGLSFLSRNWWSHYTCELYRITSSPSLPLSPALLCGRSPTFVSAAASVLHHVSSIAHQLTASAGGSPTTTTAAPPKPRTCSAPPLSSCRTCTSASESQLYEQCPSTCAACPTATLSSLGHMLPRYALVVTTVDGALAHGCTTFYVRPDVDADIESSQVTTDFHRWYHCCCCCCCCCCCALHALPAGFIALMCGATCTCPHPQHPR